MKNFFLLFFLCVGYSMMMAQPVGGCPDLNGDIVFVNEFHYSNIQGDLDEGIELAGPSGTNLADYQIFFYNGANGLVIPGTELNPNIIIPGAPGEYGTVFIPVNNPNDFQNGAPDGFVLFNQAENRIVQFLSYEGQFTAVDGIAAGITSTNIPVSEPDDTPVDFSLQLSNGAGFCPSNFEWVGPLENTRNAVNDGQIFADAVATNLIIDSRPGSCVGTDSLFEITVCVVDNNLGGARDSDYDQPISIALTTGDVANIRFVPQPIDPTNEPAFDGCVTFVVDYTAVEDIEFTVSSGVLPPVLTGPISVQAGCQNISLLTAITDPCGDATDDRSNELFTAETGSLPTNLSDLTVAVSDPTSQDGDPDNNETWSLGGNDEVGDATGVGCGGDGLSCHKILDVNDPDELDIYNDIVADLNADAGCLIFAAPDNIANTGGQIPANSHVLFFNGAGGIILPDGTIEPNSSGFGGPDFILDFSIFCDEAAQLAPIYVILGAVREDRGTFSNNETRTIRLSIGEELLSEVEFSGGNEDAADNQIESISNDEDDFLFASNQCIPPFLFSNNALSIDENDRLLDKLENNESDFRLMNTYPNPTSQNIHIQFQGLAQGNALIHVMDLTGRILYVKTGEMDETIQDWELEVNHLSQGLYLYQIEHLGKSITGRFVKE